MDIATNAGESSSQPSTQPSERYQPKRHAPHLRGRQIGMFYAGLNRQKNEQDKIVKFYIEPKKTNI